MGKKNQPYLGRGLHKQSLKDEFQEKGKLNDLLKIVKSDSDLVMEIRNDYVILYYKGGNLAKIESANSIQFDYNYYKGCKDVENTEDAQKKAKKDILDKLKNNRDYKDFVSYMKTLMDSYWNWLEATQGKSLTEKDTQHALCIRNTEDTEYTVIDVEFQISTISEYKYQKMNNTPQGRFVAKDKKSPRFDIIARRNSDKQLCVIELKSGTNALYEKSGIGDHADSFEGTIMRNDKAFVKEIKGIIEDKKALGLLSSEFDINDAQPEFIYAYSYKENDKDKDGNRVSKQNQKQKLISEIKRQKCEKYKVIILEEKDFTLKNALNIDAI